MKSTKLQPQQEQEEGVTGSAFYRELCTNKCSGLGISLRHVILGPGDALSTRRTSSSTGVIGPRLSSTHHGIDAIIHRINVAPTFAARECASGTDCAFTHAKAFCSCSGCRGGQHVSTCGSPIAIRICCADCCSVGCIYLPTPASSIMQRVVIVPVACGQCVYPPGSDITWGGLSVHKIGCCGHSGIFFWPTYIKSLRAYTQNLYNITVCTQQPLMTRSKNTL